ncbi:MAG: NAD-dependent epimerase/dehydratase family protein [Lachnospiraceae bacterium]|nr:NAD-dependent epimerase/dehydratase family protein [Lachnospiraceae bacterium]
MLVVTGGAGFIGSVLLWQLNVAGRDDIIVVDHLGESNKWRNLVKRRYADYMPRERFRELLLRDALPFSVDGIVHLGACSATTELNSDFLMDNNFHYSQDLCRYALEKGIRIVVASSASTYGDGSLGFSDNLDLLHKLKPLNMYGYSKHLLDLWILREGLQNDIASLKFFNVYGPNEYHTQGMKTKKPPDTQAHELESRDLSWSETQSPAAGKLLWDTRMRAFSGELKGIFKRLLQPHSQQICKCQYMSTIIIRHTISAITM